MKGTTMRSEEIFIELDDDLIINTKYIYSLKKYMQEDETWVMVILYKDGNTYVLKSNDKDTIDYKYYWVQKHLTPSI